jgi:hypothetical protein
MGRCQDLCDKFNSHRSLNVEEVEVQPPKTNMELLWKGSLRKREGFHGYLGAIDCTV